MESDKYTIKMIKCTATKDSSMMAISMEMVSKNSSMEIHILVPISKINSMGKANTLGKMEPLSKELSIKD